MKRIACLSVFLLAVGVVAAQDAQTAPPGENLYQITITFHQLDGGKRVISRSVEMEAVDGEKATFRQGSRVPYQASANNINYADVGTNLDFLLQPRGTRVLVSANIEVSNTTDLKANPTGNPVLGQFRQTVRTLLMPGQKATICKYDDPATGRQHEVELEVKRLK